MKYTALKQLGFAALTFLGFASTAMAGGRNPGSLLIYPEFDNRTTNVTLLTVTNTNETTPVTVEFIYRGKYDNAEPANDINCLETNFTRTLTQNDTYTVITNFQNPDMEQGFVYVFAKDFTNSKISFNYLIGHVLTLDGMFGFEYSINPIVFKALGGVGADTDLDGDGLLDLDGCEYEKAPAEILIPRFLGQNYGGIFSELILLGLTGGRAFDTTLDFLIYNDNEVVFSREYTFRCWDRVPLNAISGVFDNYYLQTFTNDDPDEIQGADHLESGWIWIRGAIAQSVNTSVNSPAIYAVLIERINNKGASDLPFERGENGKGSLFSSSIFGDSIDTCQN